MNNDIDLPLTTQLLRETGLPVVSVSTRDKKQPPRSALIVWEEQPSKHQQQRAENLCIGAKLWHKTKGK